MPPMARADTYGDLAKLEQLLDEYATVAGAGPGQAARPCGPRSGTLIQAAAAAPRPARSTRRRATDEFDELRAARRRLPVRDQGRADPRRAAHPRPARPAGEPLVNLVLAVLRATQVWGGRRRAARPAAALAGASAWTSRRCSPTPGAAAGSCPATLTDAGRTGRPRTAADVVDLLEALAPAAASSAWRRWAGPPADGRAGGRAEVTRRRAPGRRRRCWSSPPPRWCPGWPAPPTRSTNVLRALDGRLRPGRPVRLADPRPGQRAAHRPQLLLRRPQGHPVPQRLGRRRGARRLAARPAPRRHRRVPARRSG